MKSLIGRIVCLLGLILGGIAANAQSYTSFRDGASTDSIAAPTGGVCLMGGRTEDDNAMRWFLNRANGGDILVIRTSGSDGYNNYLLNELGVQINSVESIVFNTPLAADESYIHQRINEADGIWIAGGDQWNYVLFWRDNMIDQLINQAVENRNIVIGGTSAGMAILGRPYFSAENGTVTSEEALADPFRNDVTVDSTSFINARYMRNVITDTHYDERERKGRHVVFMARAYDQGNTTIRGIACDEYTAVCIDDNGMARVFGGFPEFDDNAYFLQINCGLPDASPELLAPSMPLTWDKNESAVISYAVKGTVDGINFLDLNDWKTGQGGEWQYWYSKQGTFGEKEGAAPNCTSTNTSDQQHSTWSATIQNNEILLSDLPTDHKTINLFSTDGQLIHQSVIDHGTTHQILVSAHWPKMLLCQIITGERMESKKILIF